MDKDIVVKAIALKSFPYKSTHKRIELITEDNDVISTLFYKSKKNSSLTIPISGTFYLSRTKDQYPYVIKDFSLIYDYNFIYNDFSKLNSYQLYSKITKEIKDIGRYYNLLKACLALLEHYNTKKVDILFMLSIIKEQGWPFNLYRCAICNKEYNEDEIIYYSARNNTNCCANCSSDISYLYLPPNARKYLKLYENKDIIKVIDIEINSSTLDSIHRYLIRYISLLLTGGINTLFSAML